MRRPRIGIIIGTVREGRFADRPARWLMELASRRADLELEIVDLRDYPMELYGTEPGPTSAVRRWRRKGDALDGFVFLVAEYNHSISAVLKNALDHAGSEFSRKPAAFVGYGGVGAARAVEHLRGILVELEVAPLRHAVHISGQTFMALSSGKLAFSDARYLAERGEMMLDELAWWARALQRGRDIPAEIADRVTTEATA